MTFSFIYFTHVIHAYALSKNDSEFALLLCVTTRSENGEALKTAVYSW